MLPGEWKVSVCDTRGRFPCEKRDNVRHVRRSVRYPARRVLDGAASVLQDAGSIPGASASRILTATGQKRSSSGLSLSRTGQHEGLRNCTLPRIGRVTDRLSHLPDTKRPIPRRNRFGTRSTPGTGIVSTGSIKKTLGAIAAAIRASFRQSRRLHPFGARLECSQVAI